MAKKGLRKGIFITFEGVEGCGKSTHSSLIYKYLVRSGYPCVYTKEPGGTRIGEKIRGLLLDPKNILLDDKAELFLFEASRSQLVSEVIKPALAKKMIVICDRFSDATIVYQGYGDGFDKTAIKKMNAFATGGVSPDKTIIIDVDINKGFRRIAKRRKDRMESKGRRYHNKVRRGYLEIARSERKRVSVIKSKKRLLDTQAAVKQEVLSVIQRYKTTG